MVIQRFANDKIDFYLADESNPPQEVLIISLPRAVGKGCRFLVHEAIRKTEQEMIGWFNTRVIGWQKDIKKNFVPKRKKEK